MLYIIFYLNGIYDILCALTLIKMIHIPYLADLHPSLMQKPFDPIATRMLGYWIFTYGMMRLSHDPKMITLSYYIEALALLYESIHQSMHPRPTFVVIISSLMLAYIASHYNPV